MNSTKPKPKATALVTLITDEHSARSVATLVAESFLAGEVAVSLTEIEPKCGSKSWRVAIHCARRPNEAALRSLAEAAAGPDAAAALVFEELAFKDWVGESLAGLTPVAAGRFVVHGAHDRAAIPINRIGIEIEAALAFGTGHHGTTRGCLLALDRLGKVLSKRQPIVHRHPSRRAQSASKTRVNALMGAHLRMTEPRILDLGTGTGVLAIAAARALHRGVLATDIDAGSAIAARGNARLNGVGPFVEVLRAAGVNAPAIRAAAPFDLVFANILLRPLQRLAAPLSGAVAPGGHLIMSGLLAAQANAARAAYHALVQERQINVDGWATLVLKRPR